MCTMSTIFSDPCFQRAAGWKRLLTLCAVLPLLACALSSGAAEQESIHIEEARKWVNGFESQLKSELIAAMSTDGPIGAINVCKNRAPQLAAEASRRSGLKIGRVSSRVRNPSNAAEPWQASVLREFSSDPDATEHYEPANKEAQAPARYMKVIRVAGVCLACHGQDIDATVQTRLEADYPFDRARGYQINDVRGAFSVVWPVE